MKHLFSILLVCLSLRALGWDSGFSEPVDVVGTPVQQDFKLIYREVLQADTLHASEKSLTKRMDQDWWVRAKKFLEHDIITTLHPCEEVALLASPGLGIQEDNKDEVSLYFKCAGGLHKNLHQIAYFYLGVEGDAYQYLVRFLRVEVKELKHSIWED